MILIGAITLTTVLSYAGVIIKVALGLGFVIFVHELGHFLVAKACGVKCEKFYIGFDVPIRIGPIRFPRTLGKFRWGETEYGIGIIPLGGYVKMLGQDDNPNNADQEADRIRVRKEGAAEDDPDAYELDPRSYPAKAVWQRMLIISAGVVMNLIFGVILAAVAYMMGVSYRSCEIAGTSPGDPAWEARLLPGDKIVRLGDEDDPLDEHMRFRWELQQQVMKAGLGGTVKPLAITVRRDGELIDFTITPTDRLIKINKFVTLGVRPPLAAELGAERPVQKHKPAGQTKIPFQGGDRIVAIDGEKLPVDEETGDVFFHEVEKRLAAKIDQTVTVTVERKDPKAPAGATPTTVDIQLAPCPLKRLGLEAEMGPIEAIQVGSFGAKAGFKKGDVITHVNGEPAGDPITLPQRLAKIPLDEAIEFQVERLAPGEGDGEKANTETVTINVAGGRPQEYSIPMGPGARLCLDGIGVAYSARPVVKSVAADGPAAKAGIQAKDKILKARYIAPDDFHKEAVKRYGKNYSKPIDLTGKVDQWVYVVWQLQELDPKMELELTFSRDGKEQPPVKVDTVESDDAYYVLRGLNPVPFERIHTAESVGEALALGWRETRERLADVVGVLGMLVTGKLPLNNLGGPLIIAAVAGREASASIPRLLVFLTMLSANLAILNFLPIPALDGGHMVFLMAEAVTGRPVDERLQGTLTLIGVICLLGLMLFVFANDFQNLFF